MTTIHLPDYDEWVGSAAWRDHVIGHDDPVEGCPGCAVRPMLAVIHEAYFHGPVAMISRIYALSDGYGEVGLIPEQGYDWSGIRDSSPQAVAAMHELVVSFGR